MARPRPARLRNGSAALAPIALALLALLAAPAAAREEVRRMEVEGVAPVRAEAPGPDALRQQALEEAIASAVDEVARELLAGAAAYPADFNREALTTILGAARKDYTDRFRILRDLGVRAPEGLDEPGLEGPGLEEPGAAGEYAVAAEVWVDVERLRQRLAAAGLLGSRAASAGPTRTLRVILEPLRSYRAYAFVRDTLDARPVELARGRAVLETSARGEPAELLAALQAKAPEGIHIVAAQLDGSDLRLAVVAEDLTP